LEAKILEAERAGSLKKDDLIVIRYSISAADLEGPGARPVPILERGGVYPAFLNPQTDGTYTPAAYGESFKMTPESFSERVDFPCAKRTRNQPFQKTVQSIEG
jgi:hypothetical protein